MKKNFTFWTNTLLFLFLLTSTSTVFSQDNQTVTFNSTGNNSFEVPCGVTSVTIEAWGAGGAGGGSTNNDAGGGAGGGGGAYINRTFNNLSGGENINFTIGEGGQGHYDGNGDDGEDTVISFNGTTMTAGGGFGGERNQNGQPGQPGQPSGGSQNTNGQNGSGGNNSTGGDGGDAGNTYGGGGYGGDGEESQNGEDGETPGGGGGGGEGYWNNSAAGGNGGNGQVKITYSQSSGNYCTPSFNNTRPITNVTFAGINNSSSSSTSNGAYDSYCDEATVTQGGSYNISVSSETNGYYLYYISVYIDWNQNNSFDSNEKYNIGSNNYSGSVSNTIEVPSSALNGSTRMRVIQKYGSYINSSCGYESYGSAEDYNVNVSGDPTVDYCTGTTNNNENILYIDDVEFVGTLNDVSNLNSGSSNSPKGYQDFSSSIDKPSQVQGGGINVNVFSSGDYNNGLGRWKAWVDWNKDGDFDDNGETIYNPGSVYSYSMSFGFIIPENTNPGDYRIRIRNYVAYTSSGSLSVSNNFSACETFNIYNSSYYEYGEAEDYTFTVLEKCDINITSITNGERCGAGSVTLSVNGSEGSTNYNWYTTATGGTAIATTTSGTWDTPEINETTYYYVTASNESCESAERSRVTARISPVPDLSLDPENPVVCGEDAVIELSASGDLEQVVFFIENFESGNLGVFSNINSDTNSDYYDDKTKWTNKESTYLPTDTNAWFPAIASGITGDNFALATSDINPRAPENITNSLTLSNSVNTQELEDLFITFEIFYSREQEDNQTENDKPEYVTVDVFNGTDWVIVQQYEEDLGHGTNFEKINLDLSDYVNISNLKIRFRHHAYSRENSWWAGGVAIDNVELYGNKPLSTSYTWSGEEVNAYLDEACTIPYIEGSNASSNVYIKPTLSQLQVSEYTFTVSAALSNGCIASRDVTVTNNTKIWQGTSANANWNNPNNWQPFGVPTEDNCVIVRDDFISDISNNQNGQAKNFKVKEGGEFTIETGGTLTVQEEIIVENNGYFHLENAASLIQVEESQNTGNITADRTVAVSKFDYVYWSSPVADFNVQDVSPNSPNWAIYEWIPTVNDSYGNWGATSEDMVAGKGYIVRAPNSYPTDEDIDFTATFDGTPNNGTIVKEIQRGDIYNPLNLLDEVAFFLNPLSGAWVTNYDDNWNLIGNPYPSAISVNDFVAANPNIEGSVRIWTHGNNPNQETGNPFYNGYGYNYSVSDYITYNATGLLTGLLGFDGYIGAGQGFFVKMEDGAAATENVTFTNAMRNETYNNGQFFKPAPTENSIPVEEGRMWLDLLSSSTQEVTRTLLGYVDGATNDKDRLYDAFADELENQNFYSLIDNAYMNIQGKAVPFTDADTVPMGVYFTQAGNYSIAIGETDGIFSNGTQENIYLEDTYLNITHNLSVSPYGFTIDEVGRYDDRFIIKYVEDSALGLEDTVIDQNTIKAVSVNNQQIRVVSSEALIQDITVYNINGQQLLSLQDLQTQDQTMYVKQTNNTLLVQIKTISGAIITKKLIH